jgi:ribosomal protein S18 acetylase RimI-like enzyme
MNIRMRPVTLETRAQFAALLEDANHWQKARGSEGWSSSFDDDWMLPRIERGELYLALLGGEAVAAFRILWEDRPFWGEREVGDSIYLHTFAVRRSKAGLGIGEAVIEHVAGMARARGRTKMRLDCFLSNASLIAYYERNGFVSVGTIAMKGKTLNLMERVL